MAGEADRPRQGTYPQREWGLQSLPREVNSPVAVSSGSYTFVLSLTDVSCYLALHPLQLARMTARTPRRSRQQLVPAIFDRQIVAPASHPFQRCRPCADGT